jgi:phage gpG-like protein
VSPIRLRVEYDDSDFRAALRDYRQRVTDPRALWDDVVAYLVDKETKVWATEGRSAGTPWPESDARSRRGVGRTSGGRRPRRRIRRSHELLVLTGRLRRSFTSERGAGGIRRRTRSQLVFGSRVKTANLHQQNQHPNAGRLPQRKVLQLTEKDVENEVKLVRAHVFGAANRGSSAGWRGSL